MSKKIFISFDDAAEEYALTPEQIHRWMSEGKLSAYRFHNSLSFKREELVKLCEDGGPAAPEETTEVEAAESEKAPAEEFSLNLDKTDEEDDEDTVLEIREGARGEQIVSEAPAPRSTEDAKKLVRFLCQCGKKMKAHQKYAGLEVNCPRCGRPNEVPRQRAEKALPGERKSAEFSLQQLGQQQEELATTLGRLQEELEGATKSSPGKEKGGDGSAFEKELAEIRTTLERLESLATGLSDRIEDVRKQEEQTRFDVARLFDLVERLKSETVPAPAEDSQALAGDAAHRSDAPPPPPWKG